MTRPPAVSWELIFCGRCLSQRPPKLCRPPRWYCLAAVWYGQVDRGNALAAVRLSFPGTTALDARNQRPCVGGGVWVPDCDSECLVYFNGGGCWIKIRLSINNRLIHIRLSIREKFESSILKYISYIHYTTLIVITNFSKFVICSIMLNSRPITSLTVSINRRLKTHNSFNSCGVCNSERTPVYKSQLTNVTYAGFLDCNICIITGHQEW